MGARNTGCHAIAGAGGLQGARPERPEGDGPHEPLEEGDALFSLARDRECAGDGGGGWR